MIELNGVQQMAFVEQHGEARVTHYGRVGENPADELRIGAFVTGFLAQFTLRGRLGRSIGRVHHAPRDFQLHGVRAMTVLLDHYQVLVGGERDDIHPIDGVDHEKIVLLPGPRRDLGIRTERENPKIAERL